MVWQSEEFRLHEQRTYLADLAGNHAAAIQNSTQRALSATYALAALVRQSQGSIANFDAIASEMLAYYPGAASLQLAPGGIVQQIVPLAGNEKAIGHNLLQDPTRNKEAFLARDTGRLTLAGPFKLVQGGLGAVGRLPVFLDDSQGKPSFWGFTIVLIRYPQAIEAVGLAQLTQQGIGYELWRIHPDSGQKQSITASSTTALIDPVARTLSIPNGTWTLSVAPLKGWHEPLGLTFKSALGLLFSLLLGYLVKLLFELRAHERYLEALVLHRTAEISASQAKLQAIFDAIPDLVWLKDAQGIYLDCNPMLERFFGAKKAAILGKTAYDFVDLEQVDSFREHDRQAIASGQLTVNEEWLTSAADGRRGLFEITRTPMRDGDGQLVGVLGIAHDITELKRIDRMKTEFISTVSHELRTPLTSILGSLGLIAGGVAGELPEAVKNLVGIAKNNCERLIRLINDILDIEKIESGKMHLDLQVVDIKQLVQQVLATNESLAGQHRVTVLLRAPDEPLQVRIDSDRLTQVLTNLLSNAEKFSPPESTVEVRVSRVARCVRVEVADHGPGIPEEFRSRIFQKFSQADSSDSRQKGGTGLGLNISRALVEQMGGQIGFSSEAGAGTTFFFELPEWKEPAILPPPLRVQAAASSRPCSKPRILHVEDDPDIQRIVAAIAADVANFEFAATLDEARARLREQRFDLVLLDPALGQDSGWDLFEDIDALDPRPPVIVFSARDVDPPDGKQAEAVLLKAHTSNSELLNTIQRALHISGDPGPTRPQTLS